MATLKVDLVVDDKGKSVIAGFGQDLNKVMIDSKSQVESLGKALAVGGAAVAAFAAAGLVIAGREMGKAVELANAQIEAETKLAAVLKATGESAGFNAQELKIMAAEMQSITTVGDEVILGGMAILATFKEIKEDGFERATMAAMDMSTIMGTDLNSAITQVGKALNDPIKGMTALTRSGVSFTEQQKEQVKALQESGDMIGAQNIILAEMEAQFGGAAAAMRDTYGGAITALGNTWGDLYETVGMSIVQNETFIELAKIAEEVISGWNSALVENSAGTKDLASTIVVNLVGALGYAIQGVGYLHTAWVSIPAAVPVVVDAFQWAGDQIFQILRGMLLPLDGLFAAMEKLADFVGKDFTNPFDILQAKIDEFGEMTQAVMEESFAGIARVRDQYNGYGDTIDGMVERLRNAGNQEKEIRQKTASVAVESIHTVDSAAATAAQADTARIEQQSANHLAHSKTITDSWLVSAQFRDQAEKDLETAENQRAADRLVLEQNLTKEIMQLTMSERDYAIAALEAEYAAAVEMAGEDKDLQQMLTDWKILKLQEIEDENLETTEDMAGQWGDFAAGVQDDFQTVIADYLKGEYSSIGDAWSDLMGTMIDKFVDVLADMATAWVASKVSKLFTGWDVFHDGVWNLKDDEVPAILQQGEMVIPKVHAEEIRKHYGDIGDGDFGALTEGTMHDDVGNWGSTGTFGGHLGTEYGKDLAVAGIGVMTGAMTMGQAMEGIIGVENSVQNFSTAASKAGIDAFGLGGVYSDIGQFGAKAVSIVGLSGASGVVQALGVSFSALVGAYLGDLIGDLLNDREFEGIRDAIEDGYLDEQEARRFMQESLRVGAEDQYGGSKLGEILGAFKEAYEAVKDALNFQARAARAEAGADGSYGGDLSDYGGDMGRGGWGDDGDMSVDNEGIAHTGGYLMGADEGRIIAQTGEGVLSRLGMRNLHRLNSEDFSAGRGEQSAADTQAILLSIAASVKKSAKILERFEYTGIPASTRSAVA